MATNITTEISGNQVTSIQSASSESCCCCSLEVLLCICFFLGIIKLFRYLHIIFASVFRRRLNLHQRYGGGWAVITGGSEGIGQAIAIELAKQNFNIILVSRSLIKLETAKQKISQLNPNIKVQIYSIDFEKLITQAQYAQSFKQILKKDVSILVNNVGYYTQTNFNDASFSSLRSQMKINLIPISVLTSIFSQKFKKRQMKSGLINISSGSALSVFKGISHYSATKTFDDFFSRAVREQIKQKVDVLTVRPFLVTTTMTSNVSSPTYASAQQTAVQTVNSLGNTDICYGPLKHRIQGALMTLANPQITSIAVSHAMAEELQKYKKAT